MEEYPNLFGPSDDKNAECFELKSMIAHLCIVCGLLQFDQDAAVNEDDEMNFLDDFMDSETMADTDSETAYVSVIVS